MEREQGLKGTKRRILVVDDDPSIRGVLTDLFVREGFEVCTAPDGPSALIVFHTELFDLIFVDYLMPCMTGLDVAAVIRELDPLTPIILVTGEAERLEAKAVVHAGISQILSKPFTPQQIIACLQLHPQVIPLD
jgi:two-component system phosphate regulon response regulator OmpR